MKLHIADICGITLNLHWTFLVVVSVITLLNPYLALLYVLAFSFVVLHELGHCLTAIYLGDEIKEILLTPLGGMAVLDGKDYYWWKEFYTIIAGPLVSLISAVVLLSLAPTAYEMNYHLGEVVHVIGEINIYILLFNMTPCYPMDGGKILRSLLSGMSKNFHLANRITAAVSLIGLFCMFSYGIVNFTPMLCIIAFVMFIHLEMITVEQVPVEVY